MQRKKKRVRALMATVIGQSREIVHLKDQVVRECNRVVETKANAFDLLLEQNNGG